MDSLINLEKKINSELSTKVNSSQINKSIKSLDKKTKEAIDLA